MSGVSPRDPWDAVIVAQCSERCCWRQTCSNWVQEGVAMLWRAGKLTDPAQCVFYAHRVKVHRDATGFDAPASVAELETQLAGRASRSAATHQEEPRTP